MNHKKAGLIYILMFSLMLSVFAFIHQASANVDSVTYKGTLNGKRMHVYKFTTVESGTLNIEDIGTDPTIGISLQDINNPENRYASGDMLPAGTYEFTVYTNEDITSKYNLTLSGVVLLWESGYKLAIVINYKSFIL